MLHKNPNRLQFVEINFGIAHVVYPEAGDDRCTAALTLDIDPIGLVRNRRGPAGEDFSLGQYVNDGPYALSSFMSVPKELSEIPRSSAICATGFTEKGQLHSALAELSG